MNNEIGISIYLQSGVEKNKEILAKAKLAEVDYVFSSLNISEEYNEYYIQNVMDLLTISKEYGLNIIFDINEKTLERLKLKTFTDLYEMGIHYIRLDDGFTINELVELAKKFNLILNASTLTREIMEQLIKYKIDLNKVIACHNFYPKPYTGLSYQRVKCINDFLHQYQIKVMAFVPGNQVRRGPLFEGLPTVEENRGKDFLLSVLQLHDNTDCDIIMVGDIDISDQDWLNFKNYRNNIIELKCNLDVDYEYLFNQIQHDRVDHSEYLIRSVESRTSLRSEKQIIPKNCVVRKIGSVCISNALYGRYEGEVEIIKKNITSDEKVNVCGSIVESSVPYLNFINRGRGFILKKENKT